MGIFWLSPKTEVYGGMCEEEPKSVNSVETKRKSLRKRRDNKSVVGGTIEVHRRWQKRRLRQRVLW
jgi:hypothetical protein